MPSGGVFGFGPYQLDARSRTLLRDAAPVALTVLQLDLLYALVAAAPKVVPKNRLIDVAWHGTAVGDSSLEKQIFQLRQRLDPADANRYIRTAHRRGYQFIEPVSRIDAARADVDIYAVLAPYRAWIVGLAALETLERDGLAAARSMFEELVRRHPNEPLVHVGLAITCALQFESTRAEFEPDTGALLKAIVHAHEACRLGPHLVEVWATLGFVLGRVERLDPAQRPDGIGDRIDAAAALQRAVRLEPDNWLHAFRQSEGSWGGPRYRAARRTLELYRGFPLAHLLAATVMVAMYGLADAERDVDAALATMATERQKPSRFSSVAVHWLKGLLCFARDAYHDAMAALKAEIARERLGHLYGKECCAQSSYAIGAIHLWLGEPAEARAAFQQANARGPRYYMAQAGIAILDGCQEGVEMTIGADQPMSVDIAMARGAVLGARGDTPAAVRLVLAALEAAPPGNAGWTIPIDPLLRVKDDPDAWAPVLQLLRDRAA